MKMRALPRSFWQQPNILGEVSPTTYCRPLDNETEKESHGEVIGVANTELLFSLFQSVESAEIEKVKSKPLPVIRRGRPRKRKNNLYLRDKKDVDPFFASATIPAIQNEEDENIVKEQQVLAMISMSDDSHNVLINNSYLERLSNLVVNL